MDWFEQILLLFVSLAANVFSAFAGGAGLLQFPALIFFGLPFGIALAVGVTLRHLREKSLERRFALFVLAAGLPGVVAGAGFILQVPDRLAQVALRLLTLGLGVYSWFNKQLGLEHVPRNRHRRGYWLGGAVLFLIGILNGSLTSGIGLFCTLWLVRWFGLDYRRALVDRQGQSLDQARL